MSFSDEPTCSSKVGELMKPSWRCIRTLYLRKHLKIAGKMDAHLLKYGMLDLTNSCNSIVHNLQKNPNKKITNCTSTSNFLMTASVTPRANCSTPSSHIDELISLATTVRGISPNFFGTMLKRTEMASLLHTQTERDLLDTIL